MVIREEGSQNQNSCCMQGQPPDALARRGKRKGKRCHRPVSQVQTLLLLLLLLLLVGSMVVRAETHIISLGLGVRAEQPDISRGSLIFISSRRHGKKM